MMDGRLEGKTAAITGGASGMGRATVLRYLQEGAFVLFGDLNDEAAEATLDLAQQAGYGSDRIRYVRTNVAEESDVAGMVEAAVSAFGKLDIVFSNAGIGGAIGAITDTVVDDFDETFAVLTRSVFLGLKHGAAQMIRQGHGGVILATSSIAGRGGGAGPFAYSAAKAAVINMTYNAAIEFAPHRIRVNSIAPGVIVTPLSNLSGDISDHAATMQPWPEAGASEDIANLALFLASAEAGFITGENYKCDGGLLARGPRLFRPGEDGGASMSAARVGMTYGSTGVRPKMRDRD
jgi:NAD(P)-dependent dehydrogenase (short-subunit alcohol dehydrogenase family)